MHVRLLISFLLFTCSLAAQQIDGLVDVVQVKGGTDQYGTLIGYEYGKAVTLIRQEDGELVEIPWSDVSRVVFRIDRQTVNEKEAGRDTQVQSDSLESIPSRSWYHQLSGLVDGGRTTRTFGSSRVTSIGIGIEYHYVRQLNKLKLGFGPGIELMSARRGERVISATGFTEYGFGEKKVQFFGRMMAGAVLPIGSDDQQIDSRSLSLLLHPSIGIDISPSEGRWGHLLFDLGYRFTSVEFETTTPNLEVIFREINYRRLVLRMGMRF